MLFLGAVARVLVQFTVRCCWLLLRCCFTAHWCSPHEGLCPMTPIGNIPESGCHVFFFRQVQYRNKTSTLSLDICLSSCWSPWGGGALEVLWEFTSSFGPCAVLPADLVSSLSSFVDFRFRYLSLLSFLGFKSGLTLSLLTFAPHPSFPTSSTSTVILSFYRFGQSTSCPLKSHDPLQDYQNECHHKLICNM